MFLNHFSQLWSDSNNINFFNVVSALPNELPMISNIDCGFRTCAVTKNEVY